MAKKGKKQPVAAGKFATPVAPTSPPAPISVVTEPPAREPAPTPTGADDTLIRFDRRVRWTLGVFAALFLLFVLFKWHYVSLPVWNTIIPDGSAPDRGLVAGTPRPIRMDDYAVGAPWILSNVINGFPLENEAIGGLKTPLLAVPAKHVVALFKPGYWGFTVLDTERGYAWMYDSSPFILLAGAFLFFLLISGNQYLLSLTGALALLFSSGTVKWSFIPSAMIGYCCLAFVAAAYLLSARKPGRIALFAGLLVWGVAAYALILYPPYQVPLAYLFGLAFVGYVIDNRRMIFPLKAPVLKLVMLIGAAGLAGLVLAQFFADVSETITAASSTVYPGQRSETGGTGFIANWYSEYYSWFFSDQSFPKSWLNSCELAHYVNFAPIVIPLSLAWFALNRRIDWLLALVSVFVVLMWIWVEIGFPEGLAKGSLMNMVPTRRAQIPLGVGGIVLVFAYLAAISKRSVYAGAVEPERAANRTVPVWATALAVLGIVGFVVYTAYVNVNDSDGLIKPYQTFVPVSFFIGMNGLLLFTIPVQYRTTLFCAGLLVFLSPNLKANPLSKGLSPITENAYYRAVRQLVQADPQARWMVNGSQYISYLTTATGAKQITGVKYIPDRKNVMRVLDPEMKRDSAYNRYAHVTYQSYINGRDSVIMVNQFEDAYVIAMDPCSPRMKQLNVKYQVFDHPPQPAEVRCMKSVAQLGSLTIYQANP